jgi:hypothetical protein
LRRATAAAAAVLALVSTGCEEQRRRWAAERAVRAYDEALAEAYRMSDASRLSQVAGEGEVGRVQVLIDLKLSSALVLESRIESLTVTDVRAAGPDGLVVRTRERWRYHDRPTRPGRPPGPVFVAEMEMEWDLARVRGTWRVEKGRTLSSTYLEPKGFVPGKSEGHGHDTAEGANGHGEPAR